MSEHSRSARAVVIALCATAICISFNSARADKEPAGGLRIAVIDPGEAVQKYKYTVSANTDLKKQSAGYDALLRAMQRNQLLTAEQQAALGAIEAKDVSGTDAALTPKEKEDKKKLIDENNKLADEFQALNQKQSATLTDAEKTRLTELGRRDADTAARATQRHDEYKAKLDAQADLIRSKINKDVHEAIAKVAKEKGYNVVFSSETVLYAENDITPAVLDKLNK